MSLYSTINGGLAYLDLDGLALVVHVDALAAGLLVAIVGEAHGGAVGRGEGAEGLLAGAEVHVGGVLVVVEGDSSIVDGVNGGGEGHEGGGEEELEGRHCGWLVDRLVWWLLLFGLVVVVVLWMVVGGGKEEVEKRFYIWATD